ncbi:hypothetical protein FQZ97_929480 [compost metagenome]
MIGTPSSMALASCWLFGRFDCWRSMAHTTPAWCSICWMASCSCWSSTWRSVTTITLWKYGSPSGRRTRISEWAVQAMVLVLPEPALCWIRYGCPGPSRRTAPIILVTPSHWWKRGKIRPSLKVVLPFTSWAALRSCSTKRWKMCSQLSFGSTRSQK